MKHRVKPSILEIRKVSQGYLVSVLRPQKSSASIRDRATPKIGGRTYQPFPALTARATASMIVIGKASRVLGNPGAVG
jgi:hypothetical protein